VIANSAGAGVVVASGQGTSFRELDLRQRSLGIDLGGTASPKDPAIPTGRQRPQNRPV